VAAARGGEVDQKPVIGWPVSDPASDAVVVDISQVAGQIDGDRAVLVEVTNPFFRVGSSLKELHRTEPAEAARRLDRAVEHVRAEIAAAMDVGADGILYRLHGASAAHSTPMEYGGHYLERDREILSEIGDARLNVLFLVGDEDLYFDFVSDLPAHVLAWDREATGLSLATVRELRTGALASSDPESEIMLSHSGVRIADRLERP